MSVSGIDFTINHNFTNNDNLLIYYDFTSGTGTRIDNQQPAVNTTAYAGVVINSRAGTEADARTYATGTFLSENKAKLSASNIKVDASNLNFSLLSAIFDFEFDTDNLVTGGVLFGSLDKTSQTINGEVVTGAKGYNFGITDRGHLFYQGFDKGGDFMHIASDIELSKRNIVSFSLGNDVLQISRFDYLNEKIQKHSFNIDTEFISNSDQFYLGGSNSFYRESDGDDTSFSGYLNEFALFSGFVPSKILMNIGSGIVGDYFYSSGASTTKEQVTGYSESIIYKTGITGYDFNVTGTLTISTGRDMQTGSSAESSSQAVEEGDKYYKYYTLNNGDVKTFYKEEIGYLDPNSGYTYVPTGSGAFATLGLSNVGANIATHVETEGVDSAGTVTLNLYESVAMTGILNEISGVTQTALTETIDIPAIPVSGITLTGDAEKFKKNYIYFLEERL
jgi:hypothetical protein